MLEVVVQPVYTAEALSTGAGRDGRVRTADGRLDLDLAAPVELGGAGDGANPELLFAAGYAACFHNSLRSVARMESIDPGETAVGARVVLGRTEAGDFRLAVQLEVVVPDLPLDQARRLAEAAHRRCPYSNAVRGNIEVTVGVVAD